VFDPGKQTNPEFNRRVFVGIGAGAAAVGSTIAGVLAQGEGFGQPHPPIVPETDPTIRIEHPDFLAGITAYAAIPKNATASTPGVVLVQHIWGVDATIRDDVRRFAKEGFVAIAPDLFSRMHAPLGDAQTDYTIFLPYAQKLDARQNTLDLEAAAAWIRKRAGVASDHRPPKVGITGFCMGGTIALQQTWKNPKPFDAAAIWYGDVKDQNAAAIAIPIEGNYGARDNGIPAAAVQEFAAKLKVPHDIKVYDEAGHGFFDDTRSSYVASAAADAWSRTLAFFRKYLSA